MDKIEKEKLKAFFAAQLYEDGDLNGPDYSEETGGDLEGFSLEAIGKVIDKFDPRKFTAKENTNG